MASPSARPRALSNLWQPKLADITSHMATAWANTCHTLAVLTLAQAAIRQTEERSLKINRHT